MGTFRMTATLRSLAAATLVAASSACLAGEPEPIRPGLWRLDGTLLRVGPDGTIAVDPTGTAARSIERIAKGPLRAVVLTSSSTHDTPAGVPVVVHRGARTPSAHAIRYDVDHRLVSAGVVAEVEHVGRGRSASDSVVYFPDLRVLAVGELYTAGTPQPDCAAGGSHAGWSAAIAHLLWFDFDVAVPSRGPAVDKDELRAFKARLDTLAAARAVCS